MSLVPYLRLARAPLVERHFTYGAYGRFLDALDNTTVVPLKDYVATPPGDSAVVGLRHDVDVDLASAVDLARLEHARGLRATYFILHTAPYYARFDGQRFVRRPEVLAVLQRLQDDLGHEIGWHNDLVTLQVVYGIDAQEYLADELAWLRAAGIHVAGVAGHGSDHCHRYGYDNRYFFRDLPHPIEGFPNAESVNGPRGQTAIAKAALADFGFAYDAYHLDNGHYFSDASVAQGRRWHPRECDWGALQPGSKTIVLTHPLHWGSSVAGKWRRSARRFVANRR